MTYPEKRDLDGVYFRVQRDGKWESVCFSDLTAEEQQGVMDGRTEEWLRSLCVILASALHSIGDQFGIAAKEEDNEDDSQN